MGVYWKIRFLVGWGVMKNQYIEGGGGDGWPKKGALDNLQI